MEIQIQIQSIFVQQGRKLGFGVYSCAHCTYKIHDMNVKHVTEITEVDTWLQDTPQNYNGFRSIEQTFLKKYRALWPCKSSNFP